MEQLELEQQAFRLAGISPGTGQQLERYLQVGRHYRWRQMARRGVDVLQKKMSGDKVIGDIAGPAALRLRRNDEFLQVAAAVAGSYADHRSHAQGDLPAGQLVLLNESQDLGWPIHWKLAQADDLSHLWRFQLQYHEYLLSHLADRDAVDDPQHPAWQTTWQLLGSWTHQHTPDKVKRTADAWHPYCISRRASVWAWLLSLGQPLPELETTLTHSLFQQMEYLHDHLEHDLRGNHLFENLTALAIVGSLMECERSKTWLATAQRLLKRELRAQVLEHGEHFELSPMYHCQILGNVLRIACLTKNSSPDLQRMCLDYARRMWAFLQQILHPDGEIPLFADSGFAESPSIRQLTLLAEICGISRPRTSQAVIGHYWTSRAGNNENMAKSDFLIFDFGPVGPDELPAHAHCDLLNIEASVAGRRWIVDSGNFDYDDGSMRHYCRSSVAHNVLTVGGQNQCDVWSKFRMGRRGRVRQSKTGRTGSFVWAEAAHDGYRHLGVPRITRLVAATEENSCCWICADFATADRQTELVGYLHFSPTVTIEPSDDLPGSQPQFALADGNSRRHLSFFGTTAVEIVDGWYCPAFGFREKNRVLVYRQAGVPVQPVGWLLQGAPATCQVSDTKTEKKTPTMRCESPNQTFEWRFD